MMIDFGSLILLTTLIFTLIKDAVYYYQINSAKRYLNKLCKKYSKDKNETFIA
jgi:hypothetical protein